MSVRTILFALLLFAAAGMGLVAYQSLQAGAPVGAAPQPPPPPLLVNYLAAARPMPAGTLVRDSDLTVRPARPDQLPPHAIPDSPEARASLRGALVPRYVEAGAALTLDDVLRPRDRGFLATVLGAGNRAVSVPVDAVTGVAGLIWPGDRVDVLLTQQVDAVDAPPSRRVVSRTILTEIRVIAVDQQIVQGAGAGDVAGKPARTVTLEVTAGQAELLAVAERLGVISLSIRPLQDTPDGAAPRVAVFSGDVSPELPQTGGTTGFSMQVIQGDQRSEVKFR